MSILEAGAYNGAMRTSRFTMSQEIKLTSTSHVVLGLFSMLGEATPYDLKRVASVSVGHLWPLPHTQLYAESERLAGAGYLTKRRERDGRCRKLYTLTDRGRKELEDWLRVPADGPSEWRDIATLKLFFGADARELAEVQRETHERQLAAYEMLREHGDGYCSHPTLAFDHAARHEREAIRFWSEHVRAGED